MTLLDKVYSVIYTIAIQVKVSIAELTAYKASFLMNIISLLLGFASYGFLGRSIEYQLGLQLYGNATPVGFILTGAALWTITNPVYRATQSSITPNNFEEVLLNPAPVWFQVVVSNVFNYLWGLFQFILLMLFALGFGMSLSISFSKVVGFLILLIIIYIFYSGIGLLSSGMILRFKQGDPVLLFRSMFSQLLTGILFPVTVLPNVLQVVAWLYPETWVYYYLRLILFSKDFSLLEASGNILVLFVVSVVILYVGYRVQKSSVEKCRKEGMIL